jgi:hypothetical protein
LSQKYPTQKRASEVTQEVEDLPSKHDALNSNSSITGKKKKIKQSCLYAGMICSLKRFADLQ